MTKNYYENSIHLYMKSQTESIASFYSNYLDGNDFKTNAKKLYEIYNIAPYKIEFIDADGYKITNSLFFDSSKIVDSYEVQNARNSRIASYAYTEDGRERILTYAAPLMRASTIVGFIRTKVSLSSAQKSIEKISIIIVIFVGGILIVNIFLSISFSNSITKPILNLDETSLAISRGDLTKKASVLSEDEIGRLARTMNMMADELSKTENLKNRFIATISHELRTPLTSIKGWALTLLNNPADDDEDEKEGLSIIATEAERLSEIVNELLDFSRVQTGNIILNLENIELNGFLESVCNQMKARVTEQKIDIVFIPDKEDLYIKIDKKRMRQVMINLLDNAIKSIKKEGEIKLLLNKF